MIVTTGMDIEGKQVAQYLGVVRGIVVRATGIGRGFVGGLKSIVGGNIEEWSVVCEEARREAFNRMVQHEAGRIHSAPDVSDRAPGCDLFGDGKP